MPRDKLTARGRAARERILAAAEPIFAARGFYGANVRELAAAADTPTASLLHHFATKEKLYAAVLGSVAAGLEALFDGVLDSAAPHAPRLEAAVAAYLDWSATAPERSNLLLRELLDNPARLGEGVHLVLAPLVERLSAFIRAGQRAGELRDISPIVFITHIVGGAAYFAAARPTFDQLVSARRRRGLARRFRLELAPLITEPLVIPPPARGR
jgi:TetR/AcrR family transcriptional regulator